MDEGGFIFSVDSILMLIPVFILIATVSGMSLNVPHESPYYQSQDVMETLYNIGENSSTISLSTIANNISSGDVDDAGNMAKTESFRQILDKSYRNYELGYMDSSGTFKPLVSKGSMGSSPNIASVTRIYNGVTFKLYMW